MSCARHSSPMRSIHACFRSFTAALLERRVVQQDLDAVRARLLQPPHRPHVQQVGQPSRRRRVVARLLVGQQQPLAMPVLGRRQPVLRVQQDGRRVLAQHIRHQRLEVFQVLACGGRSALLGQRLLQRSALVHGGGRNHAALIRDGLQSCEFSGGQLHGAIFSCVDLFLRRLPINLQFALQLQFYTAPRTRNVTAVTQRFGGMIPVLLKGTASAVP